jgi:hypothetical protein
VNLQVGCATARARLLPSALAVSELPHLSLTRQERDRLRNGQSVTICGPGIENEQAESAVFDESGQLVAIVRRERTQVRPVKVFKAARQDG